MGASVLLSDVDVIWLQDPFRFLYRDSDVEGMSDGWDERTAFGYRWRNDGGAAASLRLSARNSGLFFLSATEEVHRMMVRLKGRMERESVWDQTAYNEEQFYAAVGGRGAVGVSSRVMNYFCNLNSKTFFRFVREDAALLHGFRPLSVHVNYHPEKPQRMVDLHAYYRNETGDGLHGIHKWNGGEGEDDVRVQGDPRHKPPPGKPHIDAILKAGKAEWGGVKWIEFSPAARQRRRGAPARGPTRRCTSRTR